jgi:hypothetical protein
VSSDSCTSCARAFVMLVEESEALAASHISSSDRVTAVAPFSVTWLASSSVPSIRVKAGVYSSSPSRAAETSLTRVVRRFWTNGCSFRAFYARTWCHRLSGQIFDLRSFVLVPCARYSLLISQVSPLAENGGNHSSFSCN